MVSSASHADRIDALDDSGDVPVRSADRTTCFKELLQGVELIAITVNLAGEITYCNDYCVALSGWPFKDVQGLVWSDIFDSPWAAEGPTVFSEYPDRQLPDAWHHESDLRTRNGRRLRIRWNNIALRDASGEVIGAASIGEDITERRQLEHLLLGAIATERRHLAAELHDGLGQELFGLSLLARSLANSTGIPPDALREELLRIADLSRKAMETCRGVAHGLSPLSDLHGSLVDALRKLALMPANWNGPEVTFSLVQSSSLRLGSGASDHLFRLAQEGLANALKHAAAKAIRITLDIRAKLVTLEIVDDGIGLNVDRARAETGIGLKMMRFRANLLHGTFRVERPPTGGTRLVIACEQDS